MQVLSFVYQEGLMFTYIVSADSVVLDNSGKIPSLYLRNGSYKKFNYRGELVDSVSDNDAGAVPCWGNSCDDIVRLIRDAVARNEHITGNSGLDGLMCLLDACDEFKEAVAKWSDTANVAFVKNKTPIRKTIVCGNDIFSLVGVTDDRIYYMEGVFGNMLCLDVHTRGILNEALDGCIKEAMTQDLNDNKMVWYTPQFPFLVEEARRNGAFDSTGEGVSTIVEFVAHICTDFRGKKDKKDVTFRVVGKNVKAVPSNDDINSPDAFPIITFDDGMVQVLKDDGFVAFLPSCDFAPEDVVTDVLSRLSCGEIVNDSASMSLRSVKSDNSVFNAVLAAYTAKGLYMREISGRKIPEQILLGEPDIELYRLGGASEDNLFYYSEAADMLIVVDTRTGSLKTRNSGIAEGLLMNEDEEGKLIFKNEGSMKPIPIKFMY